MKPYAIWHMHMNHTMYFIWFLMKINICGQVFNWIALSLFQLINGISTLVRSNQIKSVYRLRKNVKDRKTRPSTYIPKFFFESILRVHKENNKVRALSLRICILRLISIIFFLYKTGKNVKNSHFEALSDAIKIHSG